MKEKSKRYRLLGKITGILLAVLVVLVFLSRTIANAMLPQVEISLATSGQVPLSTRFDARIAYPDRMVMSGAVDYQILEVLVGEGQQVEAGDPVFRIDLTDYEIQRAQMELALMQLDHMDNGWLDSDTEEELELQEEIQEKQLAQLDAWYPQDGILRAPGAGVISRISAQSGKTIPREIDMAVITPPDTTAYAVFEVTSEQAVLYEKVTVASVQYTPNERNAPTTTEKSEITRKIYQNETDTYLFYVPLESTAKVSEGQRADVYLADTSPMYNTIVPLSAVHEDNGELYVFAIYEADGLFGKEDRVSKVTVVKQDENDFNMAIEGQIGASQKVVVNTSKPLSDGQRVRVMNDA